MKKLIYFVLVFCAMLCIMLGVVHFNKNDTVFVSAETSLTDNQEEIENNYVEIHIFEGETESTVKINKAEPQFILPKATEVEGKLFIGWNIDGKLYPENATLEIHQDIQSGVTVIAEYSTYSITNGAWIRAEKPFCMRFGATLTYTDYVKLKPYLCGVGIIVMPTDLLETDKEFTLSNYIQDDLAEDYYFESTQIFFIGETFDVYATMENVSARNFNRNYSARAYLKVDFGYGEQYIWDDTIVERNAYYLSMMALESELPSKEYETLFTEFINEILNVTYDGNNVYLITPTESIQEIKVVETGESVTIFLQTQIARFSGVIYNGKRVKGSIQTYENGTLIVEFLK